MSICYGREGSIHTWAGSRVLGELKPDFPVTLSLYLCKLFWDAFLSLGNGRVQTNDHLTKNNLHIPNENSLFEDNVLWSLSSIPWLKLITACEPHAVVFSDCYRKNSITWMPYKHVSQFWRLRSPRPWHQQIRYLLPHSHEEEGVRTLWDLFYKGTNPIWEVSTLSPNLFPKAPPLNLSHWGLGLSIWIWERHMFSP